MPSYCKKRAVKLASGVLSSPTRPPTSHERRLVLMSVRIRSTPVVVSLLFPFLQDVQTYSLHSLTKVFNLRKIGLSVRKLDYHSCTVIGREPSVDRFDQHAWMVRRIQGVGSEDERKLGGNNFAFVATCGVCRQPAERGIGPIENACASDSAVLPRCLSIVFSIARKVCINTRQVSENNVGPQACHGKSHESGA